LSNLSNLIFVMSRKEIGHAQLSSENPGTTVAGSK
jgi:hypothetical protein